MIALVSVGYILATVLMMLGVTVLNPVMTALGGALLLITYGAVEWIAKEEG